MQYVHKLKSRTGFQSTFLWIKISTPDFITYWFLKLLIFDKKNLKLTRIKMNLVINLKQVKRAPLTCCFSFTGETALPQIWNQNNADSPFKRGWLPIYQTQDQAVSVECKDYYLRGEKDYLKLCYYYQEHLNLKSLRVTSFQFLLTISPLNQTLRSWE